MPAFGRGGIDETLMGQAPSNRSDQTGDTGMVMPPPAGDPALEYQRMNPWSPGGSNQAGMAAPDRQSGVQPISDILNFFMQMMGQPQHPVVAQLNQQAQGALPQAIQQMQLTPQEQFLYQHHLNNLTGSGKVMQPNGDISTLLQAVVTGPDGRYYNIPTVWEGKALDPRAAADKAGAVGWDKWPSYDTPEAADTRYEAMHQYIDQDTAAYRQRR